MSDGNSLSKNNVRVHLTDVPASFSPKLKKFLTSQPDFNAEIQALQAANEKALQAMSQSLSIAEQSRQDESRKSAQMITKLERRLSVLEGK